MAYASGKFARALCYRCAFEYPLHSLKEEWNGLKTCPECFETKHPQLEPHTAKADPEAIYQPRPDTDKEVGEGYVVVVYTDIYKPHYMSLYILLSVFVEYLMKIYFEYYCQLQKMDLMKKYLTNKL